MGAGARRLLFERLVDEDPQSIAEPRPLRTHDRAGLQASVLRRLDLLLNTRVTRPRPERGAWTVLDYGLPDHSALYTRDPEAHRLLAREIERAIAAFEPRLERAEVRVAQDPDQNRTVRVTITGLLRGEATTEPVAFVVPLRGTEEEGAR